MEQKTKTGSMQFLDHRAQVHSYSTKASPFIHVQPYYTNRTARNNTLRDVPTEGNERQQQKLRPRPEREPQGAEGEPNPTAIND